MADDLPELTVADAAAWQDWLAGSHGATGVWLVLAKKDTRGPRASPTTRPWRRPSATGGSTGRWAAGTTPPTGSALRPDGPERLVEAQYRHRRAAGGRGPDAAAGAAEVDRAKADGRWAAAYAGPATIEMPADLAAALAGTGRGPCSPS